MTSQRTAVITGASSGIGKAAAIALAADGWRIISSGRDPARIAAAEADIRAASRGGPVDLLRADLSLLAEAGRLAADIAALTPRVDLLLNNAGGMASELVMTSEGLEANFAGNHLGPFVLTNALLPLLRTAAAAAPPGTVRVLNTASDASEMLPALDLTDLQGLADWNYGRAYCTGKLANVLHARGLAARLAGDGIVAHAVHPGAVDTRFFSYAPTDLQTRYAGIDKASEADGADTLVWLATAPEGGASSGGYWYKRAPRAPNPLIKDADFVARFWEASERLVADSLPRLRRS